MQVVERSADGGLAVVRDETGYNSLVTLRDYAAGDSLGAFTAREVLAKPNYLTVQVAADRHILLAPKHLQYINHSCEPNVCFDTARGEVVAVRALAAGDPVTFFYPSTEWAMDRSFTCHCGTPSCLGTIAGASQLDPAVLARYRLADHIVTALGLTPSAA